VGERHGAWHLPLQYWIKTPDVTQIYQTVRKYGGKDQAVLQQRLRTLVDNNPALKTALPIMLERGDPSGCELALMLAFILPADLLLGFAGGRRGSDSMRLGAARKLVALGIIDGKQPFQMYVNGVQTEVMLQEIEIYTEPEPSEIPKRAQDLMQAGYDALSAHNFVDALKYVEQALSIAPDDRILLGHKINALLGLRRNTDAEKLAQDLVAAHPDYFFARCLMAQFCIQKRKFDEAEDWLKPLIGRDRYHISEFRALSQLNVMLYEGRGDRQTAGVWRAMGESVLNTE
jgi:tetratricopeptide (TPR) repeat protein